MQDIIDILRKHFPDATEEQLSFGEKCYSIGQTNIADFLNEQTLKKEDRIKKLKTDFANDLKPFLPTYGKEMLNEFYSYWSESNKSHTKLKYQQEPTWELALRLARWANNQRNVKTIPIQQQPTTDRYK